MEELIEELTNEELVIRSGRFMIGTPNGMQAQEAQAELTRRLMTSIEKSNKLTSVQNWIMIALTLAILILTLVMILK